MIIDLVLNVGHERGGPLIAVQGLPLLIRTYIYPLSGIMQIDPETIWNGFAGGTGIAQLGQILKLLATGGTI
jgi:hypothetical protein